MAMHAVILHAWLHWPAAVWPLHCQRLKHRRQSHAWCTMPPCKRSVHAVCIQDAHLDIFRALPGAFGILQAPPLE